jgi:hypothetical protein
MVVEVVVDLVLELLPVGVVEAEAVELKRLQLLFQVSHQVVVSQLQ